MMLDTNAPVGEKTLHEQRKTAPRRVVGEISLKNKKVPIIVSDTSALVKSGRCDVGFSITASADGVLIEGDRRFVEGRMKHAMEGGEDYVLNSFVKGKTNGGVDGEGTYRAKNGDADVVLNADTTGSIGYAIPMTTTSFISSEIVKMLSYIQADLDEIAPLHNATGWMSEVVVPVVGMDAPSIEQSMVNSANNVAPAVGSMTTTYAATPCRTIYQSLNSNLEQINQSAMMNIDVNSIGQELMLNQLRSELSRILISGVNLGGGQMMHGLATLDVAEDLGVTMPKPIRDMSDVEFNTFLGKVLEGYIANSSGVIKPDTFMVSKADKAGFGKFFSTAAPFRQYGESLEKAFSAALDDAGYALDGGEFKIPASIHMEKVYPNVGNAKPILGVLYSREKSCVSRVMPIAPYFTSQFTYNGFTFNSSLIARVGGIVATRPEGVSKFFSQ